MGLQVIQVFLVNGGVMAVHRGGLLPLIQFRMRARRGTFAGFVGVLAGSAAGRGAGGFHHVFAGHCAFEG